MKHVSTPAVKERSVRFGKLLSDVLATGKVKPNPVLLLPNGLAGVQDGYQYMAEGKVRLGGSIFSHRLLIGTRTGQRPEDHLPHCRHAQGLSGFLWEQIDCGSLFKLYAGFCMGHGVYKSCRIAIVIESETGQSRTEIRSFQDGSLKIFDSNHLLRPSWQKKKICSPPSGQ